MSLNLLYIGEMAVKPDRDTRWVRAFEENGVKVNSVSTYEGIRFNRGLRGKIEKRFHVGRPLQLFRENLIEKVKMMKPDWVHFRMPLQFDTKTLKAIKSNTGVMTQYCNDDPFSSNRVRFYWRNFIKTLPLFDSNLVYRQHNIKEFESHGGRNVLHSRPCYVPWQHFIPEWKTMEEQREFSSDAAFAGHFEPDNRVADINYLVQNGIRLKVYGGGWKPVNDMDGYNKLLPIAPVYAEDYNKVYNSASAGICFFSKLNRDTLTERTFEIPATGGVLVCERTTEAMQYFEDGMEAFFFDSKEELLKIVRMLSTNPNLRKEVAAKGYQRLLEGKHSIEDRVAEFIGFVKGKGLIK